MIKEFRSRLEHATGLVVSKYPSYWSPEYHLRAALRGRGVDLAFDVGAFRGDYGREFRRLGYTGEIISFEPVPSSFRLVEAASADDTQWTVQPMALGAETGTLSINLHPGKGELNSALSVAAAFADHPYWSVPDDAGTVAVPVTTLAAFCSDNSIDLAGRTCLLKTDTQGLDAAVVQGARPVMESIAVLQVELPIVHMYEGAPTIAESLKGITDLGFALSNITPIARLGLVAAEVDCLFVRAGRSEDYK